MCIYGPKMHFCSHWNAMGDVGICYNPNCDLQPVFKQVLVSFDKSMVWNSIIWCHIEKWLPYVLYPPSKYERSRPVQIWLPSPIMTNCEQCLRQTRTPFFFGFLWFSLALVCQKRTGGSPVSFACSRQKQTLQLYLTTRSSLNSYVTEPVVHIRW